MTTNLGESSNRRLTLRFYLRVFVSSCLLATFLYSACTAQSPRVPLTTSRVKGSPTPPLPFRTERVFGDSDFDRPVAFTNAPGTDSMFLLEQGGKIFELEGEQNAQRRLVGDLAQQAQGVESCFGLAFHPRFESNREIYVCYRRHGEKENGSVVSRFRLSKEGPLQFESGSEQILYTWLAGGHNGGCVKFGPDGMLYVSAGDAASPFPPDPYKAGQDLSTLLSKIVRIDVDHQDAPLAYRIPQDNPFVRLSGARPEIYSYGFRNPWRFAFDRETGDLWVGDVGWELWEMIYCVESGGNYGWSIFEGPHKVNTDYVKGPTPILKPAAAHDHTEARSITGGQVYYGDRLPELKGAYVYGDHVTGRIWALRKNGDQVDTPTLIARAPIQIICFGLHNNGEVYVVDYQGSIHWLVRQENTENSEFPKTLTESGLFSSVPELELAEGVVPYEVNVEPWMDGATASRFVAIPGDDQIGLYTDGGGHANWDGKHRGSWRFPKDSVLGKTISMKGHRIETQLLHYDGQAWMAYTYVWNKQQSDATLAKDKSHAIDVQIEGESRPWAISNRGDCMICHSNANDMLLGFKPHQLASSSEPGEDQLRMLENVGLFDHEPTRTAVLTDPFEESADLDDRARSYLHVNCAHCHRPQGGGAVAMNVLYDASAQQTRIMDEKPLQGSFGIEDAKVIASGDPFHSVLLYRFCKLGPGHMPKLGGLEIDRDGAELLYDWILSLGDNEPEASVLADDTALPEGQLVERLADPSYALAMAHAIHTGQLGGRQLIGCSSLLPSCRLHRRICLSRSCPRSNAQSGWGVISTRRRSLPSTVTPSVAGRCSFQMLFLAKPVTRSSRERKAWE